MVKEFLSQRGVKYIDRDVSRDPTAAQELQSKTGRMAVPVTIIDGQTIVGFDQARLEQALAQQPPQRPSFGAAVADASKITGQQGSGITLGAYVGKVRPGSAAASMGLVPGDIITEVNMQRIANADDVERALSRLSRGSRFSVVFLRDNKTHTVEGTL